MQKSNKLLNRCFFEYGNGIRIKPQEPLVKVFEEKSVEAIRAMDTLNRAGIAAWIISTSYYAKYFAVYTILAMLDVTCENHDCTIALFRHLFKDKISKELLDDLKNSKKYRIEAQYHPIREIHNFNDITTKAKKFVLEMERVRNTLNSQQINELKKEIAMLSNPF